MIIENLSIKRYTTWCILCLFVVGCGGPQVEYEQIRAEYEVKIDSYCELEKSSNRAEKIAKDLGVVKTTLELMNLQMDDPSLPPAFKDQLPKIIDALTKTSLISRLHGLDKLELKAQKLSIFDQKRINDFYIALFEKKCSL